MKRTRFTQTAFHFTDFQIFDTRLPEAKAIAPMEAASFCFVILSLSKDKTKDTAYSGNQLL
jgi:hypothetical protein